LLFLKEEEEDDKVKGVKEAKGVENLISKKKQ